MQRGGELHAPTTPAHDVAMNILRFNLPAYLCALLAASSAAAATNEITEPFQGVRLIHTTSTVPRLVDMWVVEIDTAAPGLGFMATPSNGSLPGDTTPQTTRAFGSQIGAQIGINANFFSSAGSGQYNTLGLSVSNGDAYSPFQSGFRDALNVSLNNIATIIRSTSTSGFAHTPPTSLYNAVGGNTRLVTGGVNVANSDPAIHPRTAAAVTADGKLLLFTVDGRNEGHSEGLTYREMADVLIRWGARDGVNLDGGGSTTLVMDNPVTAANDVQVMNIPSDLLSNGQPGRERANGNNFGVFASRHTGPTDNVFVFADFEQADPGTFNSAITFSGSNRGFNGDLSSADTISGQAHDGQWSQRLTIIDDPNSDGDVNNPGGAWFVRHVSGGGNPTNNIGRPAIGSVGLWAKTSDPNRRISLTVDDASGLTGERGLAKNMIADGQWHPYFWDVADPGEWEGWVHGDGVVDTSFTLDSIHIFGPPNTGGNLDAVVYIDAVTHITPGLLPGDFNGNGVVDAADYVFWRKNALPQEQYDEWRANFGITLSDSGSTTSTTDALAAVPEPSLLTLSLLAACGLLAGRRVRCS